MKKFIPLNLCLIAMNLFCWFWAQFPLTLFAAGFISALLIVGIIDFLLDDVIEVTDS